MSVFGLQFIAMVTMFCDHLGCTFFDNMVAMRCVGRFAFIIYAFLLAEGYRHFKNDDSRVSRHLGDYVVLAIISEIGYDLMEAKHFVASEIIDSQSAMITLLLGFLGLIAIEKWNDKPLQKWSAILLTALMSFFAMSNYKFAGPLLIYAFYYYQERYLEKSYLTRLAFVLGIFVLYIPIYHWARYNFCDYTTFLKTLHGANTMWYLTHIPIACLIASYKGELGIISSSFKKVYRAFYPAHLFVLGIIFQLFFNR